jgi:hypothetical protein
LAAIHYGIMRLMEEAVWNFEREAEEPTDETGTNLRA